VTLETDGNLVLGTSIFGWYSIFHNTTFLQQNFRPYMILNKAANQNAVYCKTLNIK